MLRFAALLLLLASTLPAQHFDVLITNAKVIDGSGAPWFFADIGIRGDSIAAVGLLPDADAPVRVDAQGLVAAPGFIDIHSHGRRGIFQVPTADNYLRQGVTTFVEGPDGSSPLPLAPFLEKVSKTPISVNFATFVGQGTIRQQVIGLAAKHGLLLATGHSSAEEGLMIVREGHRQGVRHMVVTHAVGELEFSTGP